MEQSNQTDKSYNELLDRSEDIIKRSLELQNEAAAQSKHINRLHQQSEAIIRHSLQLAENAKKRKV